MKKCVLKVGKGKFFIIKEVKNDGIYKIILGAQF